jgi:hypothetical protein
VARVMGIDLTLDASWFLIVAVLIYSLGFIEFPRELHPGAFAPRADLTSVVLGIAAVGDFLRRCWRMNLLIRGWRSSAALR